MDNTRIDHAKAAPLAAGTLPGSERPLWLSQDAYAPCGFDFADLHGCERRLARDQTLFRRHEALAFIYLVRFGHLKSERPDHRGHSHITAFHMSGDLLGLEAIGAGQHTCTATALEDSLVCEISYARLQEVLQRSPGLMASFHNALSHDIVRGQNAALLHCMNGSERLATLLLDLSARYVERGYSGRHFRLRMSRADMGAYLGLTIESVSRLLAHFREEKLIALERRDIELRDPGRLRALLTSAPGETGSSRRRA